MGWLSRCAHQRVSRTYTGVDADPEMARQVSSLRALADQEGSEAEVAEANETIRRPSAGMCRDIAKRVQPATPASKTTKKCVKPVKPKQKRMLNE